MQNKCKTCGTIFDFTAEDIKTRSGETSRYKIFDRKPIVKRTIFETLYHGIETSGYEFYQTKVRYVVCPACVAEVVLTEDIIDINKPSRTEKKNDLVDAFEMFGPNEPDVAYWVSKIK